MIHKLLVLLSLAGAMWAEEPTMDQLRDRFEGELLRRVGVSYDAVTSSEIVDDANAVAERVFLPHIPVLMSTAREEFDRIAGPDRIRLETYVDVAPEAQRSADSALALFQPAEGPFVLLVNGWSPTKAAQHIKSCILSRVFATQELGSRTMLAALVPDRYCRLNADYQEPVIAIQSLNELFVVTLRFNRDRGIYLPVGVKWKKRMPEPAPPH